ncbi:PD-(D/E)XK nuclease family protein [Vibrio parahaemolyticus]|uniref:PD-(D/E)XK nuclease family protein n=1 Tax=Vibrio parahaemolyticus TaxID=670 RepID=UPI002555BBBD|nr:PD-(D/E)XK nuclease family protein [Vibrio parahaemolyticus]MDL2004489.1 PD-(D/E)XK nuclease family protein [Vibrio parahaemolyticus]
MNKPNLFRYATSELSQDAFLCWFLSWADPQYCQVDEALHQCALSFLKSLFSKHGKSLSTVNKVEITKQDSHIDVLCIVNDEFIVLIEDKTKTREHSDQLSRYFNEIKGRTYEVDNILPIYFKTFDQSCYRSIESNGYKVFSRKDFLDVLNKGDKINDSIFLDFRRHLQEIEKKVNSYLTTPPETWSGQAWAGFYMHLQKELGAGGWKYVANPSGGFMGFWCFGRDVDNSEVYVQLEEQQLCIKIKVPDKELRKTERSRWYKEIKNKAEQNGINLAKPSKFGLGKYMTVLVDQTDYISMNKEGCVDILGTVNNLRRVDKLLDLLE